MDFLLVDDILYEVAQHLDPHSRFNLLSSARSCYQYYLKRFAPMTLPCESIRFETPICKRFKKLPPRQPHLGDKLHLNIDQSILVERVERAKERLVEVRLPPGFGRSLMIIALALRSKGRTLIVIPHKKIEKFTREMGHFGLRTSSSNIHIHSYKYYLHTIPDVYSYNTVIIDMGPERNNISESYVNRELRDKKIITFAHCECFINLPSTVIDIPYKIFDGYLPKTNISLIPYKKGDQLWGMGGIVMGVSPHNSSVTNRFMKKRGS